MKLPDLRKRRLIATVIITAVILLTLFVFVAELFVDKPDEDISDSAQYPKERNKMIDYVRDSVPDDYYFDSDVE